MTGEGLVGALLLLFGAGGNTPTAALPPRAAGMLVRQYVIIRVPVRMQPVVARPRALTSWAERKGPNCLPAQSIVGATITNPSSVDLVLRDRSRVRAKLESRCPALDYYYGFYLRPSPDGQVCQRRDAIHSRMGGDCRISAFRGLVPVRAPAARK